jgi:hypothetical protein
VIKDRYLGGLESLERGWREDIDGKNYNNYNSTFHRWIRMIFGYVFLLHVLYIFTGGIFYISLRLTDITGWKCLGKYTFGQSLSPTVSPSSTVGLGYKLDILFVLMLSRFGMVEIRKNHSKQKLCFLHSRSASFRSVRLNLIFWKFLMDEVDICICYTYNNLLQLYRMDCLEYYSFGIYGCLKLLPKLVLCELKQLQN